ncbi:MAG TPA: hypothetical protein VGK17_10335 [Propionicimonas sp.]
MITASVEAAIDGLRRAFPGVAMTVDHDGNGGAYVVMEQVDLGPTYLPATSWCGFHLSHQLPDGDVYPLYTGGEVARADGQPHSNSAIQHMAWRDRPALQLSRRSNRRDLTTWTPALKVLHVLAWFREL